MQWACCVRCSAGEEVVCRCLACVCMGVWVCVVGSFD